jgi:oligo-1,6-glucosidase
VTVKNAPATRTWWKESVVYQIYPRSFCDSNGDGIGDLQGITSSLAYLKLLGIDVVWLSPIYRSPMDDMGYDISDYRDIAPEFGTLEDFWQMLAAMHDRGIKLMMDLVVNHTSDEHPWFVQSRSSKENPYRDYYIWRPPKHGREPNNWLAHFGGSAWQYDAATGEYYLHLFSRKQPDLNWENPKVRQEVYDLMHWWLRQGVDGFRMDVINMISKVPGLPEAPETGPGPYQWGGQFFTNGPRMLEFLAEMNREVLSKYDVLTVGETPGVATSQAVEITNEETGALNMLFQFEHMDIDRDRSNPAGSRAWQLRELKAITTRWQHDLATGKGWNSQYLSNHDQPRPVSRFGDDKHYRVQSAKLLGTFLHMLQGTPYVYEGEEIGMTNVAFPSISDYRDIATLNMYREYVNIGGADPDLAMPVVHARSRDNARTPMQWSNAPHAGFTTGTPWIKVNPNYPEINVEKAVADPDSVFHYYQRLINLRHIRPVMAYGVYDIILADHPQIYAFTRTFERERLLVILNFSGEQPIFELPDGMDGTSAELIIANYPVSEPSDPGRLTLRPWEARVYELRS